MEHLDCFSPHSRKREWFTMINGSRPLNTSAIEEEIERSLSQQLLVETRRLSGI